MIIYWIHRCKVYRVVYTIKYRYILVHTSTYCFYLYFKFHTHSSFVLHSCYESNPHFVLPFWVISPSMSCLSLLCWCRLVPPHTPISPLFPSHFLWSFSSPGHARPQWPLSYSAIQRDSTHMQTVINAKSSPAQTEVQDQCSQAGLWRRQRLWATQPFFTFTGGCQNSTGPG